MTRWHAVVMYRTDNGPITVEHDLLEVGDLAPLIERGPHWDTIIGIHITRVNHVDAEDLTVERAVKL